MTRFNRTSSGRYTHLIIVKYTCGPVRASGYVSVRREARKWILNRSARSDEATYESGSASSASGRLTIFFFAFVEAVRVDPRAAVELPPKLRVDCAAFFAGAFLVVGADPL